ncbi:DegT/DnrJ/EryC1/StrS family aminotransferase [Candidatus Babeliales bacterium]|nr:DegT/DnrJ/EryC1/StrS family aminotransferase [Candidatus Babeliales bacterium]
MKKNIPFFSLQRQYENMKEKLNLVIKDVLESQKFIGGNFVESFEKKFSCYTKTTHAISCNSGTNALWLALKALDIKQNDIVLTTPFSFISSSSEIVSLGAHPVFVDIDTKTFNIDIAKIETWIEKNTLYKENRLIEKRTGHPISGIIPVDIFGQCADYKKIKLIAEKYNLWIIQDSCQSIGAVDSQGKKAGTQANISCFSFYPTKNLGAFGDGGCCTTNNQFLAEKIIQLRNHGRKTHYNYTMYGINSRLDGIQAAVLNEKLNFIDDWNDKRRSIAKIYNEKLSNIDFIQIPESNNGKHVFHQYCINIKSNCLQRDEFIYQLNKMGIGTNIYYPKALTQIEFLNKDKRLKNNCPIAQNLTQTILALPIWPELKNEEVEYVCSCIKKVAKKFKIKQTGIKKETIIRL